MKKLSICLTLVFILVCNVVRASPPDRIVMEGGIHDLRLSSSCNLFLPTFWEPISEDPKNTILLNFGTFGFYTYIYPCYERTFAATRRTDFIARGGVGLGIEFGLWGDGGTGMAYAGDLGIVCGRRTVRFGGHIGARAYIDDISRSDDYIVPSAMLELRFHFEEVILIKIGTGFPEVINLGMGFRF